MKIIKNRALGAILTLAIAAPAFGMNTLKRSFAHYHAKKAVYSTLAARLFKRSTFNQGSQAAQPPVQHAATQVKPGFFGKWLAAIPLIGWIWQSNEEQWAKELLKQPTINDTLTSPSWNPNNPEIAAYVLGKCIKIHNLSPIKCGESVRAVQAFIEEERLNRLEKLEKTFPVDLSKAATEYTKGAVKMGCKTEKGLPLSLTQASDEQLRTTLMEVENKYFPQCKNPEIQERMCKRAREISFKQLQLFRNGAQGVISTPAK